MNNPFFPEGSSGGLLGAALRLKREPRLIIEEDHKLPKHKWRWHIFMSSDEVAASTQGYATKELCKENLKNIGKYIISLEQSGKI